MDTKVGRMVKLTSTAFFSYLLLIPAMAQGPVNTWQYIQIDSAKTKWGDYQEPKWLRYFGLDLEDVNGDGLKDIVSGRWLYLNPAGTMEESWERIDLGLNVDGILIIDVDGDMYTDVIGQALPDVYWIESKTTDGTSWEARKIGEIPATTHVNSQGFERAQIIAGGKEEFLMAGNGNVYCFQVPEQPDTEPWQVNLIGNNTSDEGIGVSDIDGDGDLDFVAGRRLENQSEPLGVVWFENPGNTQQAWEDHLVGTTNHAADRIGVADFNSDGLPDIIVCEERWPGKEPDGNIFWYEQTGEPGKWDRHHVVTQYSINNLDVLDIDGDGDQDFVTSEHKGPDLKLQIWENDGTGNFMVKQIDSGKESHLGTKVADLDLDGDLDIVSIGWDQYQYLHLWRNDQINRETRKWVLRSSANGDLETPNQGNQQTASLVTDVDNDGVNDFLISERTAAPALVLYRFESDNWQKYVVEKDPLRIEAGAASYDIDGDGDQDVVFGGESRSNQVWWWENPFPDLDPRIPWQRHTIKNSGANKHHDQIFGDFNGDGKTELVFWNQGGNALMVAQIPEKPGKVSEWPINTIYRYNSDSEMEPAVGLFGYPGWQSVNEHEGLAKTDMDGDGVDDIVGGGRWFNYYQGVYHENIIDASYSFTRSAAAQFIEGGRPEVLLVVGDGKGPLYLYQWHQWDGNKQGTGTWKRTCLLEELDNGHTLEVLDFNGDGHMDIFSAEMRFGQGNPDAKVRILLGDGKGNFQEMVVAKGYGVHEGRIADLDGDGDYDILGKPYTWQAPLLNIWINEGLVEN